MTKPESDADGLHDLHGSCKIDVSDDEKDFGTKQKQPHKVPGARNLQKRRDYRRKILLLTRPLYTLALGSKTVRHENRVRLRKLLCKLVRQHNWEEASGVLSALLKGTCKEGSPRNNRFKYSVAMELLRHMGGDVDAYLAKILQLYDTWFAKIKGRRGCPLKDRRTQLEFILTMLCERKYEDARINAVSLMQECESARDPVSNLVIGLTFYELWYSALPEDMQVRNVESCMSTESETLGSISYKGDDAASIYETYSNLHCHSETSVINDKNVDANFNHSVKCETSTVNVNLPPEQQFQSQGFYINSIETSTENDGSVQDQAHSDEMRRFSVFSVHGLRSLLPLRLPLSGNIFDSLSYCRGVLSNDYKDAMKYLQLALNSPSPVSEAALLPLIQLLLLDGQVKEVFAILEKFCNESSSVLPFRLRAHLWECFDANSYDKLAACFEDVLSKDPTCRHSLARLVNLHQKGDYAPDRLVEMIGLHLEATYPDQNIWREFASCLHKLSQCEEDRTSMCVNEDEVENERRHTLRFSRVPLMFVQGTSGKTWKLRGKWWLNRHFSKGILTSEIATDDLQLMTYKAACASHIYGKKSDYVTRVHTYVKERDTTMLTFLDMHMRNAVGFFPNFVRK